HVPGVVVDITERKVAQLNKEAEQRTLWAALPVPCYSLNAEGRIDFFNDAAARLWGRVPELGQEMWGGAHAVVALDGSAVCREESPTAIALRERRSVRGAEFYVVRPDGSRRRIIAHPDPIFDSAGHCTGVVNVMFDVTEERLAHAALIEARDVAVAASRAKDDFLAALSHELRTPLNPVLLLASDAAGNPDYPAQIREDFENVRKNIELEARLIDDLLDITHITRGLMKLDRSVIHLHDLLHEAAQKVQRDAGEKSLAFNWGLAAEQGLVNADPVRLQQVFWNVLKNAVKFTPPGGVVGIHSRLTGDGRAISVSIQDNGIGMDAGELERIFNAFVQGNHADKGGAHLFGGLGLGLAISHKIMELHQGHIVASSGGPGKGSCFVMELPLAAPEEKAPGTGLPQGGRPPAAPAHLRILIVEDNAGTREALQRLLTRRGHQVVTAGSGFEACQQASAQTFDLAICDVGLPDTDGRSLLIKLHRLQPGLPAIAMTGYGTQRDMEQSGEAGFLLHLTKPVSASQLEEGIAFIATCAA
ncbi:MAG: multi-sensor hybrid histidine kinase, partial [Verrucomicrobiaceae bacterium]|nr:multi-sensor hybrid histidine kinase [Verrucomicrobiaceae bacterium]